MNEKTLGIIFGIIFAVIIMAVSIALTLLFIYYRQPEFLSELCKCPESWWIVP